MKRINKSCQNRPAWDGPAVGRRRFLALMAAGSGAALAALPAGARAGGAKTETLRWSGRLLGADASLILHHEDKAQAQAALAAVLARVRGLEKVFSLHLEDSAISRLNRHGRLAYPPGALLDLLRTCGAMHRATHAAFDPTMQPLFALYGDHFARPGADPAGPSAAAIQETLNRVGFNHVQIGPQAITYARPGMAISLNGIAQGYITDQACAVLAAHGLAHTLVNFGEYRALGRRADGMPWQIGLADPQAPWALTRRLSLASGALATSAGAGAAFDGAGCFTHLINPRSGRSSFDLAGVTVMAPDATLADALSTALAVVPTDQIGGILRRFEQTGALLTWRGGRQSAIGFAAL